MVDNNGNPLRDFALTVGGVVFVVMTARVIMSISTDALLQLAVFFLILTIIFSIPIRVLIKSSRRRRECIHAEVEDEDPAATGLVGDFILVNPHGRDGAKHGNG